MIQRIFFPGSIGKRIPRRKMKTTENNKLPTHLHTLNLGWRSDIWPRSSSCRSVCAAWKQRPGVGEDRRSVRCDRSFSTVTTIARWSRHKYVALGCVMLSYRTKVAFFI
eukprot:sb/3477357/